MLIAFVHNQKAFLPELNGYILFFSKYNINLTVCTSSQLAVVKPDLEWHFMGTDGSKKRGPVKIHDYASSSTPPCRYLKNKIKTLLNVKPDYRLFLNQYVCNSFNFRDDVPYGFRDMGISANSSASDHPKEFDFIYVGEVKSRSLHNLIRCFTTGALSTSKILFLSKDYADIAQSLRDHNNIQFKGPVVHEEVKKYIQSAKFGINYVPDIEPFNQQTSTKLLEYAANKIPIITTRYAWLNNFASTYGGNYFFLNHDLSNFTWDAIQDILYEFPDLTEWTWEYKIKTSGVLDFLSSKFPDIKW